MKRSLLSIVAALSIGVSALAVPAKHITITVTQPDGSALTLTRVGDERNHAMLTTDGVPVRADESGVYRYITSDGLSELVAHDADGRTAAEQLLLNSDGAYSDFRAMVENAGSTGLRAPRKSARKATQVPNNGSPRVPIILVQYSNVKFKDGSKALDTFKDFFQSGSKSAHQYFVDQSNGKYTPQFDVYGPYTLSGTRASYGRNDFEGYDVGVGKMVAEACNGMNAQIDFSKYDNDGDGECDVVIVLYAGVGEASAEPEVAESVWPCQWELSDSEYGKALTLDGKKVDKFAVFNELNGYYTNLIDGVGTFCHEFSHCLGLPDFYDTNYSGNMGMLSWSLMDYGSYNDDGYTPIGYSAYEKNFMGWIDIPEAKQATHYTLPVFNQKNVETDQAYRITSNYDKNEYYIIENRRCQGWDKYMDAEGLMITHVTYNQGAWDGNYVNDYTPERMVIIPADGRRDEATTAGDLWPYAGKRELTDTSVPAAKLNNGGFMGKPITEITLNADGTVSLWFMKSALPMLDTPVLDDHSVQSATSFVANWTHQADIDVTYTLEVKPHRDILYTQLYDIDFTGVPAGWTTEGYTVVSSDELRLGSSNNTGAVISPQFGVDDSGQVTVAITARYYGNDKSSMVVSLLNTNGSQAANKTFTLTEDRQTYVELFKVAPNGQYKLKIACSGNKKRVILTSMQLYLGDATSAANAPVRVAESGDSDSRLITGITGCSYVVTSLTENGSFDYRVKAVPVDTSIASESDWSERATVDLHTTGVESVAAFKDDSHVEWFDLQGRRVSAGNLPSGIYVKRQGSVTQKVVVR